MLLPLRTRLFVSVLLAVALGGCAGWLLGADGEGSASLGDAGLVPTDGDGSLCGAAAKSCGGACVAMSDPAFGCGATACGPACVEPLTHGVAVCARSVCGTSCDVGYKVDGTNCVKDLVAAPGAIALRVDMARTKTGESLQLQLRISNGSGGAPLVLEKQAFVVTDSAGQTHGVSPISRPPYWVDGADLMEREGMVVAPSSSVSVRVYVPALTRASGTVPVEIVLGQADGRRASANITLEPCTVCGAVCTYLDRDLQNCGVCGRKPDGVQAMSCNASNLRCTSAAETLCTQGSATTFACVNTQSSARHCGACGVAVPAGGSCLNGAPKCADGSSPQGGACALPPRTWRVATSPTGNQLNAVWGAAPDDVWAVGAAGTLLHWNGATWQLVPLGTTTQQLNAVWGSGPSDVWVVGERNTVMHWDGASWSQSVPEAKFGIFAIWGSSANDVWAPLQYGNFLHWNGASWVTVPAAASTNHFGMWGSGPADAWAAGLDGSMFHWDGGTWASVSSGVSEWLWGMWGTSASDVWAVGDAGRVIHWTGAAWSSVPSGSTASLNKIWGPSPSDLWVVGDTGTLLHGNGATWAPVASPVAANLRGLWGSSATDIWAVGSAGAILHYTQ